VHPDDPWSLLCKWLYPCNIINVTCLLDFDGYAHNERRDDIGREPFANAQRFSNRIHTLGNFDVKSQKGNRWFADVRMEGHVDDTVHSTVLCMRNGSSAIVSLYTTAISLYSSLRI
jgi:hypothetical protein